VVYVAVTLDVVHGRIRSTRKRRGGAGQAVRCCGRSSEIAGDAECVAAPFSACCEDQYHTESPCVWLRDHRSRNGALENDSKGVIGHMTVFLCDPEFPVSLRGCCRIAP
jgi:hypothetical protein